ncbi:class I glutamine amidotransferase-like protein [Apiospora arundinis]
MPFPLPTSRGLKLGGAREVRRLWEKLERQRERRSIRWPTEKGTEFPPLNQEEAAVPSRYYSAAYSSFLQTKTKNPPFHTSYSDQLLPAGQMTSLARELIADSMSGKVEFHMPVQALMHCHAQGADMIRAANNQGSPRRVLQIAVLECEQMPPYIVQSHGNFAEIFERWLLAGTHQHNLGKPAHERVSVKTSSWNVKEGHYPSNFQGIDAIIISGSVNGVNDDLPWIAALRCYLLGVYHNFPWIKIFGSCFGHQLIAQTLLGDHGVCVKRSDGGWEVGVQDVYHEHTFAQNFPGLSKGPMCYQFLHSDEVVAGGSLPPTWSSIGSSILCQIQGLYQPGRVLTYQGHPEFDRVIMNDFVRRLVKAGAIDAAAGETYLTFVERDDTRVLAAEVLLKFLTVDC